MRNMNDLVCGILRKLLVMGVFHRLPDKPYLELMYYAHFGKKLDWENPKTLNEKVQWLKLNDRNPEYGRMVDKYEAKQYVAEKIGEEYIIPTLGVWDDPDQIDFDALPDQFVLKTTHGCGGVVICEDKAAFNFTECKKILRDSLRRNYFLWGREWPYKLVKPRVIAEAYMVDQNLNELRDYKILCFYGEPENVMVCTGRAQGRVKYYFFDWDWHFLPLNHGDELLPETFTLEKPKNLDKMFQLAKKLSVGIPLVRVDFYEVNGQVYFGELTFYPDSGVDRDILPSTDRMFGEKLQL